MIFTSFEFIIFFSVVLLILSGLRSISAENWFLLVASYVFYMSWSVPCVVLIAFVSLVQYGVGLGLGRSDDRRHRKVLMAISILSCLSLLAYFKYANFILDAGMQGTAFLGLQSHPWHLDVILPVGISFFTFQSLTYTIEVYRRNIEPCRNIRDFFLFVAFFPQLLAGPINRAIDLLPQIKQRLRPSALDLEAGMAQFAVGAVKKLVISDRIAPHVDLIFRAPGNYDGFTLLQGVVGYGIQIYCDFSGYSDMAIGAARMMGFRFMENFQMPYSALNITEFWRRWHISLSTWFRDYLYIPLGGSRGGPSRTYLNLMLTMLLCGLWHGASWNYVFWGGLHGAALAIHRAWRTWDPLAEVQKHRVFRLLWTSLSRLSTLAVVLVGWLFFRASSWSDACEYFVRLFAWSGDGSRVVSPYILSALAVVFLTHLIMNRDNNWAQEMPQRPVAVRFASYTGLALLISCFAAADSSPFIYFQY